MYRSILCCAAIALILSSCGNADTAGGSAELVASETAAVVADTVSVSADTVLDINSTKRKIIRTADIRCRVNDVYKTTHQLEQAIKAIGGQVQESELQNTVRSKQQQPFGADSLKEITTYAMSAQLTLRVPVQHLDSVLNSVPELATFIDSRHVSLDDVTYNYAANQLKNDASNDLSREAMKLARKSDDVIGVSAYADTRAHNTIDRKLENLLILDNVRYATVTIDLYQPERLDVLVVQNVAALSEPGFGQLLGEAFRGGISILRSIVLAMVHIWPLMIIAFVFTILFLKKRRQATAVKR